VINTMKGVGSSGRGPRYASHSVAVLASAGFPELPGAFTLVEPILSAAMF